MSLTNGRLALLMVPLLATACTDTEDTVEDIGAWKLVWSDEFDGGEDEAIDPANWVHDVGGDGWGNEQLEYNTDRIDNSRTDGRGILELVAKKESYEGNEYTSARIKTQDLFEFGYGRVEARMKIPKGSGIWPAFWLLGADIDEVGWPLCGEIDIMELRGEEPYVSLGTIHGPGYSAGESIGADYTLAEGDFSDEYHTFAVDIDPEHIAWSVDDVVFQTRTPADLPDNTGWVFDDQWFIILNVAVGGTFLGPVDDAALPGFMQVDYVRVYERGP